jgi:hypothetical protein
MPQRLIFFSTCRMHEHYHQAEAQPVGSHGPSFVLRVRAAASFLCPRPLVEMPVSASIPPSANTPALWARRENATKHIQELMRTVLRGPSKDVFKLSKPLKSSAAAAFNDRFVLSVQLGTGAVQWTLMLDGMRPERAPDIIFDEASGDFSTTIQYAELEAIKKWDIARETALLELLQELHGKFLKHHHERVQTFSEAHVKFELESIMAHAPHAQMRFVNDKDRTVECVIPMYHGPEVAAAAAARSSLSASAAPGAECELCRLVLVMDQAMKLVQGSLHYPASTPPTQVKLRLRRAGGETRGWSSLESARTALCNEKAVSWRAGTFRRGRVQAVGVLNLALVKREVGRHGRTWPRVTWSEVVVCAEGRVPAVDPRRDARL